MVYVLLAAAIVPLFLLILLFHPLFAEGGEILFELLEDRDMVWGIMMFVIMEIFLIVCFIISIGHKVSYSPYVLREVRFGRSHDTPWTQLEAVIFCRMKEIVCLF